jgi:membrane protein
MPSSIESIRPSVTTANGSGNTAELRASGTARAAGRAQRKFGALAANLAYHWFLTLLSAVIALLGLIGLLHLGPTAAHRLVDGVTSALPPGASGALSQSVGSAVSQSHTSSVVSLVAGIVVALWSALTGLAALQFGLGVAHRVPGGGKPVARWLRAVPLLLCTVVLGGVPSALLVFGQPIGAEIVGHVGVTGAAFVAIWTAVRWVVAIVLFSVLLACYYFVGPSSGWRWVSKGGLAGTAIFLIASVFFSFYVSRFGAHGRVYGSLAGTVILVVWLYAVNLAVLVGAELNAASQAAPASAPAATGVGKSVGPAEFGPVVGTAVSPSAESAVSPAVDTPIGGPGSAESAAELSVFQPRMPRTAAQWPRWSTASRLPAPPRAAGPEALTPADGPARSAPDEGPPRSAPAAGQPQEAAAAGQPQDAAAAGQPQDAAAAGQQEQAARPQEPAPASAIIQPRALAPRARPAPEGKEGKPQAPRATLAATGIPEGALPPLPRRVPGQSLRQRKS